MVNTFEELKLDDDLTILTSTITNIDNLLLVKDLEFNCQISKAIHSGPSKPGIHASINVVSKNILDLRSEIIKKVTSFLKLDNEFICTYDDWVYISDNKNTRTGYHNHLSNANLVKTKEIPQWTITYYVEMPNNLVGTDGLLYLKTKKGKEVSILPKTNQILMFGADVFHKPELNRSSTNKRIVYAANISILDRNKLYDKLNKSLL
jgi:hypothetical protein